MNILILGSEGFIGRHLITYYLNNRATVTGCDLMEVKPDAYAYYKLSVLSADLDSIFQSSAFDVCVNAAGSGNVGYSMQFPLSDFEANTYGTAMVLECIRKHNPGCIYVHISSAAVYGNPASLPVRESDNLHPLSPYGWHKWMSELTCREFAETFHMKTDIVRPFSVYGPGLRKQLLWELHQKYRQSPAGIDLWGTANESRDFVYVEDLVLAIDCIVRRGDHTGEAYNVASGEEITVREIAESLLGHFPGSCRVSFNNKVREGDPLNWRADIGKLRALGFAPRTDWETGMSQLVNWLNQVN